MNKGFVLLLIVAGCGSCVGPGLLTDGSTVSVGTQSRGALRHGSRLAFHGDGYMVPKRWRDRRRNYGTDELVQLLVRTARRVKKGNRSAILGIADLSPRGGGPTPEHRSHWSGRDVDLLLYATDLKGAAIRPAAMLVFDANGMVVVPATQPAANHTGGQPAVGMGHQTAGKLTSTKATPTAGDPASPSPVAGAKLDLASNWALIKALVTDPAISVQWIFVGRAITRLLLKHARRTGEPEHIIRRAMAVMHQPSDAQTHMDHMHVRIFCSRSDRHLGCQHWGPSRWLKKKIKYLYLPPRQIAGIPASLVQVPRLLRFKVF